MKSSCISHPEKERLVLARQWQVAFCDGDFCAALLLSHFEYWHNIKLEQSDKNKKSNDVAVEHGDTRSQDEGILQFHTLEELGEAILGAFGQSKIRDSLNLLIQKKVISQFSNPNPKYKFDKTKFYQFHPEVCRAWLRDIYNKPQENQSSNNENSETPHRVLNSPSRSVENNTSSVENNSSSVEFNTSSVENNRPITEITSKTTNKERTAAAASKEQSVVAAAPDFTKWDFVIAEELTANQHKHIHQTATLLQSHLPIFSLESLIISLTQTLLSKKCYTKAHPDFLFKLHVVTKAMREGKWTPPVDRLVEEKSEQQKIQQQWQHKRRELIRALSSEEQALDNFKQWHQHALAERRPTDALSHAIQNQEKKVSALMAELKQHDANHPEKISSTVSNFSQLNQEG